MLIVEFNYLWMQIQALFITILANLSCIVLRQFSTLYSNRFSIKTDIEMEKDWNVLNYLLEYLTFSSCATGFKFFWQSNYYFTRRLLFRSTISRISVIFKLRSLEFRDNGLTNDLWVQKFQKFSYFWVVAGHNVRIEDVVVGVISA